MTKVEGERYMVAHISEDGKNREESVAQHTKKTTFLCEKKGARCGLSKVLSLCGIFHDMGKNKQKFDEYIHADKAVKQSLKGTIAHASTGAKYIYDLHQDSVGSRKYMVEMISYAVAAHHGLFDCVDIDQSDLFFKKIDKVEDYEEACTHAKQDYLQDYDLNAIFAKASCEFDAVWSKIKELFDELKSLLRSRQLENPRELLSNNKLFWLACLQRLILSILIDSDWEATSDFMEDIDTESKIAVWNTKKIFEKATQNFEAYMQKKRQSIQVSELTEKEKRIFEARNTLQKECGQFAKYPAGIYCLPIPTGGGKTLSSLAYALEYCRQHPETERIIYVSPYISITEQNAQVFRDAIGMDQWILEHHSSVVRSENTENEDYRENKCARYEINWEEPFICTTFVQLMNTLFSDKSESIRRMHRLVNSVVIIDEVQSMPIKCVHTFNSMINFLNKVCNTNIILCTATQPTLEEAQCPICYSEPKYMINQATEWFRQFERVKIETPRKGQKYTFESLAAEISQQIINVQSILVVLNTKASVKKLYDLLQAQHIPVAYLTTNLCAAHRSDKIEEIKKILADRQKPIVVVSTNLIEAGVDISFECVYRSMAGLDSLAQTAGRCNRNGELDYGVIHLIMLDGENTGNMEELQQSIRTVQQVLFAYEDSDKRDSLLMPKWMEQYYKKIYIHESDKMNFPLKELDTNILELLSTGFELEEKRHYMNQAYKTAGQNYRVIDEYSFGVIVPYKEGTKLIESLQSASNLTSIKTAVRQAQRYTVNVKESQRKKLDGLIQPISDIFPNLYMVAAPGAYNLDYGITPEWDTLII